MWLINVSDKWGNDVIGRIEKEGLVVTNEINDIFSTENSISFDMFRDYFYLVNTKHCHINLRRYNKC